MKMVLPSSSSSAMRRDFLSFSAERKKGMTVMLRECAMRMGQYEGGGFWGPLNAIARRNTDFIMNVELVKQSFRDLRGGKPSLTEVEKAMVALSQSIGFKSIEEMLTYASSPAPALPIPSDDDVLQQTKLEHLADLLLRSLPDDVYASRILSDYQSHSDDPSIRAEKAVSIISGTRVSLPTSMSVTPAPNVSWKSIARRLPPPYDSRPLREKYAKLEEATKEMEKITPPEARVEKEKALSAEVEALNAEMASFIGKTIDYWEAVFSTIVKMKTVEMAHRQDVELLITSQRSEARRYVEEVSACLNQLGAVLSLVPVMAAEAERSPTLLPRIASTIDSYFHRISSRPHFKFFALVNDFIHLPRDKSSVIKFLEGIEFPSTHAAAIAELPTRKIQIVATLGTVLYLMM
ncbi:MAG: hypothetical protein WC483_02185 [Candidatus Paceibacterota bacterium]